MTGRLPKQLAPMLAAFGLATGAAAAQTPLYGYRVVHRYPHDTAAFTEGLFYRDGRLFESTGEPGRSSIREVELETGKVLRKRDLPPPYFGEGIVAWRGKLIELTWQTQIGFIYDLESFRPLGTFNYRGEGWALTTDGKRLIMSDGTPDLRFFDPETLKETGRLRVTDQGRPVENLNELEWVKSEIYANIWQTDRIARIDPSTGVVKGWIDLSGLLPTAERTDREDVLNGIAYDAKGDRLFVTGKDWPALFQIELVRKPAR